MEKSSPYEEHRLHVLPTSSSGRRAGGFAAVFVAGVTAMQLAVTSGQRGGETVFDNWWITAPALVAAASAVGALIFGVTAIAKQHERSLLVWIGVVVGALVTTFLLGELVVPH